MLNIINISLLVLILNLVKSLSIIDNHYMNILKNLVVDVVDMEFVIHLLDNVHVILDILEEHVATKSKEDVHKIVEDMEIVN